MSYKTDKRTDIGTHVMETNNKDVLSLFYDRVVWLYKVI